MDASTRICIATRSQIGKFLPNEKLMFESPGPYTLSLLTLPKVPGSGAAKAFTLNHSAVVPCGPDFGFPTRLGYCAPDPAYEVLFTIVGVNELPDCNWIVADVCHPPRI